MKVALEESFERTDEEFRKTAIMNGDISGSTAILSLIRNKKIYVANCGDSRAFIYEGDKIIPLSSDHKPFRKDEKKRIELAGKKQKLKINK